MDKQISAALTTDAYFQQAGFLGLMREQVALKSKQGARSALFSYGRS
jgi:hypothetical protein